MTLTFTAAIKGWNAKVVRNAELVFQSASQRVVGVAQLPRAQGGRMRVDTGFLRNSLVTQLNGSTMLTGGDAYSLVIAQAQIGDRIFAGWTASYAAAREFGARGQAPDYFMRGAAQQWQAIVNEEARKVAAL